ncbi:MAG: glycosyltransferase family 39 protein [Rubripirellula sp.]|nr:glycosyltransferase family 39 protein [Rubripirellula sp.]
MSDKTEIDESLRSGTSRAVWLLAALALLVRGAVGFVSLESFEPDPDAYRAIAEDFAVSGVYGLIAANGEVTPTAFRPPLYPFSLSWLVRDGVLSALSVAVFHGLLGALTVVMTFLASRRIFGPVADRSSILASLLVLVDPILLHQSTEVMTETLATALTACLLWLWGDSIRSSSVIKAVLLGLAMALAYLCRPTFLVWGILLCAGWLVAKVASSERRAWLRFGLMAGLFSASVAAWTARNVRTIGHPVWATTHGGYTLLLANNPSFYEYLSEGNWGEAWDSSSFQLAYLHRFDGDPRTDTFWQQDWSGPSAIDRGEVVGITEHDDDRLAYEAAKATIYRQPRMFVWSCLVRATRLWSPFPHATQQRSRLVIAAVGGWYLVLYVMVVIGVVRIYRGTRVHWQVWWPIAALLFTLTAVHAVYWSNIRMRAPAIPALAILASAAIKPKTLEVGDVVDR